MSIRTQPADAGTICEADKAKLMALYRRVCSANLVAVDDPRQDCSATKILDMGLAPTAEAALQVIACGTLLRKIGSRSLLVSVVRLAA